MTRKRFIKELMAVDFSRNRAEEIAKSVVRSRSSYEEAHILVIVAVGLRQERREGEQKCKKLN